MNLVKCALAVLVLGFLSRTLAGEDPPFAVAPPEPINARSAAVIAFGDNRVLYAKDADRLIPPASIAKLVTLHVVYRALENKDIFLDTIIVPRKEECDPYIPYRSSLMYLRPGMRVTVLDLMRGLSVASGNDAALVVARAIGGSVDNFARLMNDSVAALGLDSMSFVEPSGLSEKNLVTARQMALFARAYIAEHPQALSQLHTIGQFEFPRADNLPPGSTTPLRKSYLASRNALLETYPGCDGLKTGYIDESGYNFVATAQRDTTRFIVVTLGGSGKTSAAGSENRVQDARILLDWAFDHYRTVENMEVSIPEMRLWKAASASIMPVLNDSLSVTVPKSEISVVVPRLEMPVEHSGAIFKGEKLGEIILTFDGIVVKKVDLVADRDVPQANIFIRFFHSIYLFFRNLFKAS